MTGNQSFRSRRTFPRRRDELIVSELADEALVYDFSDHRAHCMNDLSFRVFRRCDGKTDVETITEQIATELGAPLDEALVWQALAQLGEAGLLVARVKPEVDLGRRRVLNKLALTAGLTVALPMVWSIVAPSVAEAASVTCIKPCSLCMGSNSCCGDTTGSFASACPGAVVSCAGNTCQ